MDIIRRIGKNFSESSRITLQVIDSIAPDIARAAELMSCAIINNHKVIVFSDPSCAAFSGYFVSKMLVGLEVSRPGFTAMELIPNFSSVFPIARDHGYASLLSRQLGVFGQPDDVLLVVNPGGSVESFPDLLAMAREREVSVVAITANNILSPFLQASDVCIDIPSESSIRAEEVHLIILNCICDALDCLLLGLEDV
ncbi:MULTISPECIES: SIS domain-containing protein [Candidatus Ichthyocystis]|uniref:Putative phosphoheptose isomerase n=1 Tax=Candidatus Ichthyocystis hellenicum TaxID=1561003 RepID=A0A0S4M2I5_9BURK|nr:MULTISPECIES: SIS domain-containing protein [Ichthyocystis]CUT17989.1 putative phosphoheptose isomerase [Candidatus Ichthyocystis hellenicum]